MSREYDLYLQQHCSNVAKGFYWIQENLPELVDLYYGGREDLEHQICFAHDVSKTDPEEYDAYDRYFYGGAAGRSFAGVQAFNYAWLHHQNHNPHHWQYWILVKDDPESGEIIMDMPYNYILEMICDWWSFSWNSSNLYEIFNWYGEHKDYMKLSDKTRVTVEDILAKIKEKLDEVIVAKGD